MVALISNVGHDDPFNGIRSIPDSTRWKMKHSRKFVVLSSFSRAYVVKINRNTRVTIPSNFEETGNIGPKASNENSKRICTNLREILKFVKRGRSSLCDTRNGSLAGHRRFQPRFIADGTFTFSPTFPESIKTTRLLRRKLARACVPANVSTT